MPSARLPLVPFLDQLGVPDVTPAGPQLLRPGAPAGAQDAHLGLELEQLLVGATLVLQSLELPGEQVAGDLFVEFRGGKGLPLRSLDLLRHAFEGLEGTLV